MVEHSIKNTIAIVSSRFIYENDDEVEDIKFLYKEARYKATHKYRNGTNYLYKKLNELLYKLLLKCIEEGNTPDVNNISNRNSG